MLAPLPTVGVLLRYRRVRAQHLETPAPPTFSGPSTHAHWVVNASVPGRSQQALVSLPSRELLVLCKRGVLGTSPTFPAEPGARDSPRGRLTLPAQAVWGMGGARGRLADPPDLRGGGL